ncbi:hypothetical protein NQ318_017194 [Aromia moschata]|uniref:Uncharacterized protein n=1 Tax=Aromia moschata TaxID=1265417 RepID=A0AAV8YQH1_9CUCU|nr:hypothetical protein NQ318_017194 [Aromia moschata]
MEVYMCGYCSKEVGDILKHGCFKFYEESIYDIVVNDEMVMTNGKGQMEIFEGPIELPSSFSSTDDKLDDTDNENTPKVKKKEG